MFLSRPITTSFVAEKETNFGSFFNKVCGK
jgi:hypothetical protein